MLDNFMKKCVDKKKISEKDAANLSLDQKYAWAVKEVLDDDIEQFIDVKSNQELLLLQIARNTK